jgi:hypothetical protein
MKTLKPYRRIGQAATQVKGLSPVISIITKADAIHSAGRQHPYVHNRRERVDFVGVLDRGMPEDGCLVNLGDPYLLFAANSAEYESTSCNKQEGRSGDTEVGSAHTTRSAGKLHTWGRGRRGEASDRYSGFTLHRGQT